MRSVKLRQYRRSLLTDSKRFTWGTDHFSVHVEGLTNAQRLKLEGDQIKYLQKNLVLNFSRPGDTINELEDRIRYGVPALADPERQRYLLQQYEQ